MWHADHRCSLIYRTTHVFFLSTGIAHLHITHLLHHSLAGKWTHVQRRASYAAGKPAADGAAEAPQKTAT